MSNAKVTIVGEDRASKQVGDVGKSFEHAAAKGAAFGAVAGLAFAKVADHVAGFAKDSIDAFANVGKQTTQLQRYIGGTVEDASRLRFAAQESGVGFDDLTKGLGKFEKAAVANSKGFQALGLHVRDAHGQLLPMSRILPGLADKFAKMPNGAQKTALALQLFGKGGMALLPFLNKGAAGMKELSKESDKFGLTLNNKDTAMVKANIVAKRQWHAAIQGVQVQLGRYLYPALTAIANAMVAVIPQIQKFAGPVLQSLGQVLSTQVVPVLKTMFKVFADDIVPVLATVAGWLGKHQTLVKSLAVGILTIVAALKVWAIVTKTMAAVQAALNLVMDANPIGLVVLAIAGLAAGLIYAYKHSETFRKIVKGAFDAVKGAFEFMWGALKTGFNWVSNHWQLILSILTGPIGAAVIFITTHFDSIVGFVKKIPGRLGSVFSAVTSAITAPFRAAFDAIRSLWNSTLGGFHIGIPKVSIPGLGSVGGEGFTIPKMASGGIVTRPTLALIGEAGAEAVVPLSRGGYGGGVSVVVNVQGSMIGAGTPRELARQIGALLRDEIRRGGLSPLPST